jgi:hypothetical protein
MPDEPTTPLGPPADEPLGASHLDAGQILRTFCDTYDAFKRRNERIETTRDIRRGTLVVGVSPKWSARFSTAAPFVQSALPERRTLERSVKAAVGAVLPEIARAATGDTKDDDTNAEWAEFYLNELRRQRFPAKQLLRQGRGGRRVRLRRAPRRGHDRRPAALRRHHHGRALQGPQAAERSNTSRTASTATGRARRYVRLAGAWSDGTPKEGRNPEYDRDASGRRRDDAYYSRAKGPDRPTFKRDEDKSASAFDTAQRRYRAAHLPVTALVLPALDVAPLLVRSKDGESWALKAMVTRQLLVREEAIAAGYRWAGMGDRLLIPQGYDANRTPASAA